MKCNWYCRLFPTCNLVFTEHQHFANSSKAFPQSSELQLYTLSKEPHRTHSQGWAEEGKICIFGIRKVMGYQRFGHWVVSPIPANPLAATVACEQELRRNRKMQKMLIEGISWGKFSRGLACRSDNLNHKTKGRGKKKVVYKSQAKISPRSGNSLIHLVVNLEWIICSSNGEGQVYTMLALGPETVIILTFWEREDIEVSPILISGQIASWIRSYFCSEKNCALVKSKPCVSHCGFLSASPCTHPGYLVPS